MKSLRTSFMKRNHYIIAIVLLCGLPSVVWANAGTPLMWAGMLHLAFGNLVIGLFEGWLLAKLFGLSKRKCIGLLVLANYLSAWLGGLIIARTVAGAFHWDLHNAWRLFWVMVLITYVLTLLLEYPFVAVAFRGDAQWRRKSIRGSFLIQSVSYAILFGWYWSASGMSLYTDTNVVEVSSMSLPEKVLVYFISAEDGDVCSGSLREATWSSLFDLNSKGRYDRLFLRMSTENADSWDLVACLERDEGRDPKLIPVVERFERVVQPSCLRAYAYRGPCEEAAFNCGQVPKLAAAESSSWDFRSGDWPIEGLHGTEANSGQEVSLSLETPFAAWPVRNATHLPTDKVLLQLGDDQIRLYDPDKRQIALLARGRGPIAVLERGEPNTAIECHQE